ncbi:MAG: DUF6778 family protein [Pseudomonadota bacterium]
MSIEAWTRRSALLGVLALGACGPLISRTDFRAGAKGDGGWRLAEVDVRVPERMVVSQVVDSHYPPIDHLVWWGDPPGDRKAQVSDLMEEATRRGASAALTGGRPVRLELTIRQFHAMTPLARATSLQAGVHEIQFDIAVRDASTGSVLAEEKAVNADLRAFSGEKAVEAEARGEDQKTRIQRRVAEVVEAWLKA